VRRAQHFGKAKGVKFGRKPKLTPHQQRKGIKWRDKEADTLRSIARSLQYQLVHDFEAFRVELRAGPRLPRACIAQESPHFFATRKSLNFGFFGRLDGESAAGEAMRASKEQFDFVHEFLSRVFIDDLHAKRVLSLANGALGVMTGACLAVSLIGQALAKARGLLAKSAIKQVDRLLSNAGVVPWDLFGPWVREAVGVRPEIVVAMDWTDFDADNQSTLALHLVTRHGRATPLLWLTVDKDELKNQRNDFEDLCLSRLKTLLPEGVRVTILADRGFGDVKLFEFLESLGFQYVIRFRGNIHVSATDGETRLAADWVGKGGRAVKLRSAEISAARQKVGAVVCVKAAGMKEAWHLAASDGALSAPQIIKLYSKRWTIEPSFRDSKDLRFGMGMSALRIDDPQRRDRLLLLNAFAILLLTLLGAAGESLGMDRQLRTSTVKRRVHSLFRQGCLLYELIPNMPEQRLSPLVEKYQEILGQNATFSQAFGIV